MLRLHLLQKYLSSNNCFQKRFCTDVIRQFNDPNLRNLKSDVRFFSRIFDVTYQLMHSTSKLPENAYILQLDRDEVLKSMKLMCGHGATQHEIFEYRNVLQTSYNTIKNRMEIFYESGFTHPYRVSLLAKYLTIINKPVVALKNNGLIPLDLDVAHHLLNNTSYDIKMKLSNEMPLKEMRKLVLNEIIKFRLDMTDDDVEKMWSSYTRMQHKSYYTILTMIDILENEFGFTKDKIKTNLFLLYGDPENARKYLEDFKKIAGLDIRDVLQRRPKVIMSEPSSIREILDILNEYKIPQDGLLNCLELLTLAPCTIRERIQKLKKIDEFNVLLSHPRVLRLIHYFNKANIRLEYLKEIKMKCISLNVLSSSSVAFEKYAKDGFDKTKGVDIIMLIKKDFSRPRSEIRKILSRHHHWCSVPTKRVKRTLDALRENFRLRDIYNNLHIVLYPINSINEKLSLLKQWKKSRDVNTDIKVDISRASASQILGLCVYLMEKDCHFTCDGIWEEPTPQNDVQVSHSLEVPKTLSKEYKFGIKPAAHKSSQFSS